MKQDNEDKALSHRLALLYSESISGTQLIFMEKLPNNWIMSNIKLFPLFNFSRFPVKWLVAVHVELCFFYYILSFIMNIHFFCHSYFLVRKFLLDYKNIKRQIFTVFLIYVVSNKFCVCLTNCLCLKSLQNNKKPNILTKYILN